MSAEVRISIGTDTRLLEQEAKALQQLVDSLPAPLDAMFGRLALDLLKHAVLVEEIPPATREHLRLRLSMGWFAEFRALARRAAELDHTRQVKAITRRPRVKPPACDTCSDERTIIGPRGSEWPCPDCSTPHQFHQDRARK